jgi:hypothetical protein
MTVDTLMSDDPTSMQYPISINICEFKKVTNILDLYIGVFPKSFIILLARMLLCCWLRLMNKAMLGVYKGYILGPHFHPLKCLIMLLIC